MTATRQAAGRARRAPAPPDPRLAARRRLVARRHSARRLWFVFALTLVATLAIGAITAAHSSLADIDEVEVRGLVNADEGHVLTASRLSLGTPLVDIDEDAIRTSVESVPWVASATVDWSWGGVVTIQVVEREAVAALATGSRFALVDIEGQQLEIVDTRPDALPVVDGWEVSGVPGQAIDRVAVEAVIVATTLASRPLEGVGPVSVRDAQVHVSVDPQGVVNLGDADELEGKLVALETVLANVDLRCLDIIDVRVPSTPTVRRLTQSGPTQEPLEDAGAC